jgi:hypothetical protein
MSQVPTAAQMMADIESILAFGIRRPGSAGDDLAMEYPRPQPRAGHPSHDPDHRVSPGPHCC